MSRRVLSGIRYFGIGMNKTGTSSLKECFKILGLTPVAYPSNGDPVSRSLVDQCLYNNDYEQAVKEIAYYRSFKGPPWNAGDFYQRLASGYPTSQFVLTLRDPESWWISVDYWLNSVHRNKHEKTRQYLTQLNVNQVDKDLFIAAYMQRNKAIRNYFLRNVNFLVLDFEAGDGWEKLCSHFNVPKPDIAFPHNNARK